MAEEKPNQPEKPDAEEAQASEEAGAPEQEASVDQALDQAQASLDEMREAVEDTPVGQPAGEPVGSIDLLGDVDLDVRIELGRTEMLVEDVLKLATGSVVELDKLAGDPVDVYVNNRLVARGEVLVLNDNFCIRISEIVANLDEEAEAAEAAAQPQAEQAAASSE